VAHGKCLRSRGWFGRVVAAACPAALGGALSAVARVLGGSAAVVEAGRVDGGVGFRVRVCVIVIVVVAAGLEVREVEKVVTVTVVGR
jgi:hypothetical protein